MCIGDDYISDDYISDSILEKAKAKIAARNKLMTCIKAEICPKCGDDMEAETLVRGGKNVKSLKCTVCYKRWSIYGERLRY